MSNVANNFKHTRVNINLPSTLVERVKEYADKMGMPYTQTYVLLINNALDYQEVINYLPKILELGNQAMIKEKEISNSN